METVVKMADRGGLGPRLRKSITEVKGLANDSL